MSLQAISKGFTAAGEIVGGRCRYLGHVIIGDGEAVGSATLWSGAVDTGVPLDLLVTPEVGIARAWYGPQGILCEGGIIVGTVTETVTGIIYYLPQTSLEGVIIIDESGSQRHIMETHNQVEIDLAWQTIMGAQ